MPTRSDTIAEAVKVDLNEAAADPGRFGATFAAKRLHAPVSALKDQTDWVVTVYAPGESTDGKLTRVQWNLEVPVVVAVEKRLKLFDPTDEADNAEIDALKMFAQSVADFFGPRYTAAGRCLARRTTDSMPPDAMREKRRFLALVTLYFQAATN